MTQKPSHLEREFFVKEEAEKKHRLHEAQAQERHAKTREERKALHYMKCPKCGDDLKTIRMTFVDVEECPNCGALVLDKGELEKIKNAESGLIKSLVDVFQNKD